MTWWAGAGACGPLFPPGRSPLRQGAGVQQGCPHSTLPWCSSNSLSIFLTLFRSFSHLDRVRQHLFLVAGLETINNRVSSCPMAVRCMRLGLAGATPIRSSTNWPPPCFLLQPFSPSLNYFAFGFYLFITFCILSTCCFNCFFRQLLLMHFLTCIFEWISLRTGLYSFSFSSWHHQNSSHGGMTLSELHVIDWPALKWEAGFNVRQRPWGMLIECL